MQLELIEQRQHRPLRRTVQCATCNVQRARSVGCLSVAHVPLVLCVCGAYLGMLQHAIYKCAPQRCNIKFAVGGVSLVVVVEVIAIVVVVAGCCCWLLLVVVVAIAGGVADYVVGFGGCVNL